MLILMSSHLRLGRNCFHVRLAAGSLSESMADLPPELRLATTSLVSWLIGATFGPFKAMRLHSGTRLSVPSFFLGLLEAVVTPGLTILTAIWYTQSELPFRVLIWTSFNGWSGIFGGFVAYGVSSCVASVSAWIVDHVLFSLPDRAYRTHAH